MYFCGGNATLYDIYALGLLTFTLQFYHVYALSNKIYVKLKKGPTNLSTKHLALNSAANWFQPFSLNTLIPGPPNFEIWWPRSIFGLISGPLKSIT